MVDFNIRIVVDSRQAVQGTQRVRQGLNRLKDTANRVESSFINAFSVLAGASGVAASVRVLASFEQSLATVRAITAATDAQFEELRATAQRLGRDTRFTATQAGEGLEFLSRAGFSVEQSLGAIDGTLTLAQAGALGLGDAADIATNVLTSFGLAVDQTGRVVDTLAFTANRSNTNVFQLGEAFKFAAGSAALFGVDLEETSAALAVLANRGQRASIAGTGLRRLITRLNAPTDEATKIFKALGVSLDDVRTDVVNADGSIRGLLPVIERLNEAGFSSADAFTSFGDRAGPIFNFLANATGEFRQFNGQLQETQGFAGTVAQVMDDNLNGALLRTVSAAQAVVQQFGDAGLTAVLRGFLEALSSVLRGLADNAETIVNIFQSLAVLIGVRFAGVAVAAAIAAVKALGAAFVALGAAIVANPIGAIATAIAVATAAAVGFADQIQISTQSSATLQDVGVAAWNQISVAFNDFFSAFSSQFPEIGRIAEESFGSVGSVVRTTLVGVANIVDATILGAGIAFRSLAVSIDFVFREAFNVILDGLRRVLNFFIAVANTVGRVLPESIAPTIAALRAEDFRFEPSDIIADASRSIQRDFDAIINSTGPLRQALQGVFTEADDIANRRASLLLDDIPPTPQALPPGVAPAEPPTPSAATDTGKGPTFGQLIQDLQRETELLQLSNDLRSQRAEIFAFQDQLGRDLTATERGQVETLVALNDQLARQNELADALNGPLENLNLRQVTLTELFDAGRISLEQYTEAMRTLNAEITALDNTLQGGVQNGLARLQERANNVGRDVSNFVVGAFDSATDAVVNFAKTGEFNVRQFFQNLFALLIKLATQQIFLQLLGFASGGGGGAAAGAGGLLSGLFGAQNGARFQVGGAGGVDSQLVAFRASPNETVTVETPGQIAARERAAMAGRSGGSGENVNITNVTVFDRNQILGVLRSPAGTRTMLNVASTNPRQFNRAFAGA